jgi:predicted TIM-barrel enzyme
MAGEVLPVVKHTPVFAGVCASDPFRDIPRFLKQLKEMGIVGIQVGFPFPSVPLDTYLTHTRVELPYVSLSPLNLEKPRC